MYENGKLGLPEKVYYAKESASQKETVLKNDDSCGGSGFRNVNKQPLEGLKLAWLL